MPATVLERHYQDRVQSVRQIALPKEGSPSLSARDFGDLAALCLEISLAGQQLLETEFKRIFKEPDLTVAWLQERRQAIEELSDNFLDLMTSLRNMAGQTWPATASQPGHDIVAGLDEARRILAEAKQRTLQRWPAFTRVLSSEEDYVDADEAFAQIAGVDVETWRKRLEKRKQILQD